MIVRKYEAENRFICTKYPKNHKVIQYINIHGRADNEVEYYVDGKVMTRSEYNNYIKEKSEQIGENLAVTIMIVIYMLLPTLLVLIGGN